MAKSSSERQASYRARQQQLFSDYLERLLSAVERLEALTAPAPSNGTAEPDADLGKRMKAYRDDRRINQTTLGVMVGALQEQISQIETGRRRGTAAVRGRIEALLRDAGY